MSWRHFFGSEDSIHGNASLDSVPLQTLYVPGLLPLLPGCKVLQPAVTSAEGGAARGEDPGGKEDCPAQAIPAQQIVPGKAGWQLGQKFLLLP